MSKKSKIFIFVLAVLTILLTVVAVLSANEQSRLHGFYSVLGTPVRYIQKGFTSIGNAIGQRISILHDYGAIKGEIDTLREENDRLAYMENEVERLQRENEELRALLDFRQQLEGYTLVGAQVIYKDVTDWYNEFTIDVGQRDGVQNGHVVITSRGLVGIVCNAGLVSSKVRCIVDEQNALMARIARNGEIVRLRGTSNENYSPELLADRIAQTANIYVGDVLVTANSGGAYPEGLTVGTVAEVGVTPDGLRYARVTPQVSMTTLLSVSVLVPAAAQEPEP